jgi:diguanylate cyclase (GGDEF)-like protein
LIAEDDPVFRHLLQSWLQKWDYRVVALSNGLDAWNVLQQDDAPKMAILDWMMPGMDGVEICSRVRGQKHGFYRYILLLTAKDNKNDVVAGLEAGADDYLTKPFDVDELRARVRSGRRILELQDALVKAHDALQFEAVHDHLTGLLNRGAILDLLRREGARSQRAGDALGVMMIDIDHFKKINDSQGHLIGDVVLMEVAKRLSAAVRGYDAVGRYGGEEFLVVLPGCGPADLVTSAERLRNSIAECPVDTSAGLVPVTLSLGILSLLPGKRQSLDYEAMLRAADQALYRAKANGRNRVEMASLSHAVAQNGA